MTNLTRDVVIDLWPLYAGGDASADTRAAVEAFLAQDPEFASWIRDDRSRELLAPVAVALPPDHEKATLVRAQRRRARQSMIVNALALVASAAMMAFYVWKIIPRFVGMFEEMNLALPLATRVGIVASNWTVRLAPLAAMLLVVAYVFRRRIRLPELVRSGTVLAIATGAGLFMVQIGWLALLYGSSIVLEGPYNSAMAGNAFYRASLAQRSGDHVGAVRYGERARQRMAATGVDDNRRLALLAVLLLADAYDALGDRSRADVFNRDALQRLSHMKGEGEPDEIARWEQMVRARQRAVPR